MCTLTSTHTYMSSEKKLNLHSLYEHFNPVNVITKTAVPPYRALTETGALQDSCAAAGINDPFLQEGG